MNRHGKRGGSVVAGGVDAAGGGDIVVVVRWAPLDIEVVLRGRDDASYIARRPGSDSTRHASLICAMRAAKSSPLASG